MKLEQVSVSTRDGYREAEEPFLFRWRNKEFVISTIIDRWYEGRVDSTRMPMRYFKVETTGGERFILRYHEFFRTWSFLVTGDLYDRNKG